MSALQITWYVIIWAFVAAYAVLDGFDLGVGLWHLFTRNEEERRSLVASIGPFWDGNEVWLLALGGALFAAFPHAYASIMSGCYLFVIALMFSLIFRAVAIECRDKSPSLRWRTAWDGAFAAGSMLPAVLFGIIAGNILRGMRLDSDMNYYGGYLELLNAYTLLVGVLSFFLFAMHGAAYIRLTAHGKLKQAADGWLGLASSACISVFLILSIVTVATNADQLGNFVSRPGLLVFPLAALGCVALIVFCRERVRARTGFLLSCGAIVAMVATLAIAIFPNIVPTIDRPEYALTIANASSSPLTLKVMLAIAAVGMPLVAVYHVWIYRAFTRKH